MTLSAAMIGAAGVADKGIRIAVERL